MPGVGESEGHILPSDRFTVGESRAGTVSCHKNHVNFAKKRVSYRVSIGCFSLFYVVKGPCQLPC